MTNKLILDFIRKNCLETRSPEELMLGKLAGTRYSSQYYMANLLYDQRMMQEVCDEFYTLVVKNIGHFNFQLAGRDWSAIPLLTTLPAMLYSSYHVRVNSFMIKRDRKTYGKHNFVEGIPNEKPVLLVDDLCNSTNSFWHCYQVCTNEQKLEMIPFIFAIVNKYKPSRDHMYQYDRYLAGHFKALYILDGDQVHGT